MNLFERFEKHKPRYIALLIFTYLFINNSINATSEWMETTRDGSPEFSLWEPFVWEYSSAISNLFLLPVLFFCWQRVPLRLTGILRQIAQHLVLSLLFALAHVSIMVWIRELVYWLAESRYDFGPILREFFYEYRKDVWGYLFFFCFYPALGCRGILFSFCCTDD